MPKLPNIENLGDPLTMQDLRPAMMTASESSAVGTIQAALILGVGKTSVQRWIDSGAIPSHRTLGGHRRVFVRDLIGVARSMNRPISPAAETGGRRRSVLIVDDETDATEAIATNLAGHRRDLSILTANNGFEAGVYVNRHCPELVLMDIHMPGMNGIETCRIIKNSAETSDTKIVGLTSSRKRSEIDALLRAGAEQILFKPVNFSELHMLVRKHLPIIETQHEMFSNGG